MNNKIWCIFFSFIFCFGMYNAGAQALPSTHIGKVKQVGETVEFDINARTPFYVGANIFVLVIGQYSFDLSLQVDAEGRRLTFLIPLQAFNSLAEGAQIYLTYGSILSTEMSIEERMKVCNTQPDVCHYLGLFSPKILSK